MSELNDLLHSFSYALEETFVFVLARAIICLKPSCPFLSVSDYQDARLCKKLIISKYMPKSLYSQHVTWLSKGLQLAWTAYIILFVVFCGWLCNQSEIEETICFCCCCCGGSENELSRFFPHRWHHFSLKQDYLATPTPYTDVHRKDCNKALQIYW